MLENLYRYADIIESSLKKYFPKPTDKYQELIYNAMEYSLLSGGKRIRPILLLEFCRICSGDIEKALPFACAIEMIHTYSLIHDDLPCMDDDDMRRGKPSNHKMFGEDIALLAGDGLLNLAFEIITSKDTVDKAGADCVIKSIRELAAKSGSSGMILGQVIDLKSEGELVDIDILKEMYKNKTGALIEAACVIGCIVANADQDKISAAREFANSVGLAFQIVDDILDVTSKVEVLGKPIKSDINNNKSTFVSVLGLEKSKKIVEELTNKAIAALHFIGNDVYFLKKFTAELGNRDK